MAVRRQLVARDLAQYVTIPRHAREAAAAAKVKRVPFLRHIATDRLYAPMRLRSAEVRGMRWTDVDLDTGTITVAITRTSVERKVVEKAPKTEAGRRTLPLPQVVLAALQDLRRVQRRERMASGRGVADELGGAVKTRLAPAPLLHAGGRSGLRRVRPYDARHACLTWLAASGVPDVVVSAWAGRADLSFTKRVYVHPSVEHLRPAAERMDEVLRRR
ncbi:Site-specific recombinase XerD [Streptomyces sp. MP131-18]|nr:Site-specific recombinase XerD [Streptomyces sp. MP131-18]